MSFRFDSQTVTVDVSDRSAILIYGKNSSREEKEIRLHASCCSSLLFSTAHRDLPPKRTCFAGHFSSVLIMILEFLHLRGAKYFWIANFFWRLE